MKSWARSAANVHPDGFQTRHARVLVLAHTDELIEQAAREVRLACPGYTVGIVKAGLNETHARIIVSSRQTLASEKRRSAIRNVGLIIVDECHHALRTNTYGTILEHFGAFNECEACKPVGRNEWCDTCHGEPRIKVLGVTATMARGDDGKLSTVWEEVAFRRDILFGIRNGFLLDVRGHRVIVPDLDLNNVKKSGGDYQDAALADELERTFAPQKVAEAYAETARAGDGRVRQGIAFWPLVETAYHGAEAFEAAGISSAVIHGGLPKEERKSILKRFREGSVTVVHNCMVLTEGFDAPWADVVVIARPTRSAPLYQQMVGRVLRPDLTIPAEQREKALILDVTGAGAVNDLRSLVDLTPERPLRKHEDEDLSLLDLDDELIELMEAEGGSGAAFLEDEAPWDGATEVVEFDPLHRSKVWQRTAAGTPFLPAGSTGYVFLFGREEETGATWDVISCEKPKVGTVTPTEFVGLSLDDALAYGEEHAIEAGGYGSKSLVGKNSKWRKEPAKPAQEALARRLGVWCTDMTKGECSAAIDLKMATDRIDPLVRTVRAMIASNDKTEAVS
jgi:superfamily II DNA or RNA helicase